MAKHQKAWQEKQSSILTDIQTSMKGTENVVSNLNDTIENLSVVLSQMAQSMGVEVQSVGSALDGLSTVTESQSKATKKTIDLSSLLATKFMQLATAVSKSIDTYKALDNNMLKAGFNTSQARDIETSISDMLAGSTVNKGKVRYTDADAYKNMQSIITASNVKNTESLGELYRPMFLASETMSIDLGKMTTMFTRFNTRYNFTSAAMEESLNDIAKYSANQNVSQEDIAAAQDRLSGYLEHQINVQSMSDEEAKAATLKMNEEVAQFVAQLEASGMSSSDVNKSIENLLNAAMGKDLAGMNIMTGGQAESIREGFISDFYDSAMKYMEASAEWSDILDNSGAVYSTAAEAIGLDPEHIMHIADTMDNLVPLSEIVNDSYDMEKTAATKEVGFKESVSNWISNWSDNLHHILQDTLGLDGEDLGSVINGALVGYGVLKGGELIGKIGKGIGLLSESQGLGVLLGEFGPIAASLAPIVGLSGLITGAIVAADAAEKASVEQAKDDMDSLHQRGRTEAAPGVLSGNYDDRGFALRSTEDSYTETGLYDRNGFALRVLNDTTVPDNYETGYKLEEGRTIVSDSDVRPTVINPTSDEMYAYVAQDEANLGQVSDFFGLEPRDLVWLNKWHMLEFRDTTGDGKIDSHAWLGGNHYMPYYMGGNMKAGSDGIIDIYTGERIEGTYRTGLSTVPYDDYLAVLHEGERVLTREEADNFRKLSTWKTDTSKLSDTEDKELVRLVTNMLSLLTTWKDIDLKNHSTSTRLGRNSDFIDSIARYDIASITN